jgi:von Willebrand factor type D domain
MKFFSDVERGHGTKTLTKTLGIPLGIVAVAGLLQLSVITAARAEALTPEKPAEAVTTEQRIAAEQLAAAEQEEWRKAIRAAPRGKGCFTATYPERTWREIPCRPSTRTLPFFPRQTATSRLDQVGGNGTDLVATATKISQVSGSFVKGTGGITSTTTSYSLQLNTNFFSSPKGCTGSTPIAANSGLNVCPGRCCAWEQFVYSPSSTDVSNIQYWLINYAPVNAQQKCPAPISASCGDGGVHGDGWCPFPLASMGNTNAIQCAINASTQPSTSPASRPLSKLTEVTVAGNTAAAAMSGGDDAITTTVSGTATTQSGDNHFPELSTNWTAAEFNVFGVGNGSQVAFNSGSTVAVQTEITSTPPAAPGCELTSFTAESNNLTLVNSPPPTPTPTPPEPWLAFSESLPAPGGAIASCANAISVGDTHLTTFDGLKYDFQATGDFLLAQSSDLTVQTRQVLSVTNPNWIKNAAINKAVAVQIGKTQVALYIWPVRLVVDGKATDLAEGKTISLPTGVNVALRGGAYLIAGPNGDTVSVTANNNGINTWLDVYVGLGHTPAPDARGLLGNPTGNAHDMKSADGKVLTEVSFADLYQRYADGWRLLPNQSMLEADAKVTAGVPDKPFFASDLDAASEQKARAACLEAGVTSPTLLDDCTLDTVVLGDATAAKVFTRLPAPRAILPRPKI